MSPELTRILSGLLAIVSGWLLIRDLQRGQANWGGFFEDRRTSLFKYWMAVSITALVCFATTFRTVVGFAGP